MTAPPTIDARSNGGVREPSATRSHRALRVGRSFVTIFAGTYMYALVWLLLWALLPWVSNGWKPYVITSGSMAPSIQPGDVVLVDDDTAPIPEGSVVTFADVTRGGQTVTHRVVGQDGRGLLTKGDANPDADPWPVEQSNVIGVGRLVIPRIGLPVLWRHVGRADLLMAWVVLTIAAAALGIPWRPQTTRGSTTARHGGRPT